MKNSLKLALFAVTLLAALPAMALRPGQRAALLVPTQWLAGSALSLDQEPEGPEFRVAVFFMTRARDTAETVDLLEQLIATEGKNLRIAIVSPDNEEECREFLKLHPRTPLDFARDRDRKLTPMYMGGSLLFPMAFLIDREGKILWNGEVVDLPEALRRARSGKLDVDTQRKISTLLDELQQLMRDGSERLMARTAAKIFVLEPGQPTALRMRLFMLENANRYQEAWELLASQQRQVPDLVRLYFTGMDLMVRHPALREHLNEWTEAFLANVRDVDSCRAFALTLLNSFPFDPQALKMAHRLLHLPGAEPEKLSPKQYPGGCAARALLQYQLGDLSGALQYQSQATKAWEEQGNDNAARLSAARETYYRTALELSKKP